MAITTYCTRTFPPPPPTPCRWFTASKVCDKELLNQYLRLDIARSLVKYLWLPNITNARCSCTFFESKRQNINQTVALDSAGSLNSVWLDLYWSAAFHHITNACRMCLQSINGTKHCWISMHTHNMQCMQLICGSTPNYQYVFVHASKARDKALLIQYVHTKNAAVLWTFLWLSNILATHAVYDLLTMKWQ